MADWKYKWLRTAYYVAIGIVALNNLPGIREITNPFLEYKIVSGLSINLLLSVAVIVGAYMAYTYEFG
jgi:hypothetical protein